MSISFRQRGKLHLELDLIINMRNSYEEQKKKYDKFVDHKLKYHGDEVATKIEAEKWRDLLNDCNLQALDLIESLLKFSGKISGYNAQEQMITGPADSTDELSIIRSSLVIWLEILSIFFQEDKDGESIIGAMLGHLGVSLQALNAGETKEVLSALRTSGLRKNSFTRAKHQLVALCWVRHLVATGEKSKTAQLDVAMAYGESWDTIRKWEGPCNRALKHIAKRFLKMSESPDEEFFPEDIYSEIGGETADTLEECGKLYQNFRLSKEKT